MSKNAASHHGIVVDRFFNALVSGQIDGIRAGPALSSDVHDLYCTWCAAEGMPQIDSPGQLNIFLTRRHPSVVSVRKRYADGPIVQGPRSILFLASVGQPSRGYEVDWLGAHVAHFRQAVADYKRALRARVGSFANA